MSHSAAAPQSQFVSDISARTRMRSRCGLGQKVLTDPFPVLPFSIPCDSRQVCSGSGIWFEFVFCGPLPYVVKILAAVSEDGTASERACHRLEGHAVSPTVNFNVRVNER